MTRSALLALAVVATLVGGLAARQTLSPLTPNDVADAIRAAEDANVQRRVLDAYTLQTRAGWGNGPAIGLVTTPFSRVVLAALAAKGRGSILEPKDVPDAVRADELHVIALSQQTYDDAPANILDVGLTNQNVSPASPIPPVRTLDFSPSYRETFGITLEGSGIVAVFPLSAVTPGTRVVVHFDKVARGTSAASACQECIVPLSPRLR